MTKHRCESAPRSRDVFGIMGVARFPLKWPRRKIEKVQRSSHETKRNGRIAHDQVSGLQLRKHAAAIQPGTTQPMFPGAREFALKRFHGQAHPRLGLDLMKSCNSTTPPIAEMMI